MTSMSKIIAALALVAIVLFGLQVRSCVNSRQAAAEKGIADRQNKATVESAKDAIATQGNSYRAEQASENLTKSNEKDIRNAQGADVRVDPDVDDAGLRALCRRQAYRDHVRCRVFNAPPK